MDPLLYFGENREVQIEGLRKALKESEQRAASEDDPMALTKDELEAAIKAFDSVSASKRSGAALDRRIVLGLRAIIRAKYRPVLPLRWDKKSGNHLPDPAHLKSLGAIEEGAGARKWEEFLKEAFKAPVTGREYLLEDIFRQVARVDHDSGAALGTAWPLHIETGLLWITNRHVVADERSPWYYEVSEDVWEPTDSDSPGCINCNAVEYPKDAPTIQPPRPFKVADVAPRATYDIAALTAAVPRIAGLDIVWDPDDIAKGKDKLKNALRGRIVLAIGHPVDRKEHSDANFNAVFHRGKITGKHLMPGRLLAEPWGTHNGLDILRHDCSTIAGTSGSCIIDLGPPGTDYTKPESLPKTFGKVIGVHFFGTENLENHAVPSWKLKDLF